MLNDGSIGRAAVPSGASTGEHELAELRDNDPSLYLGKGVTQAVGQVMQTILPALKGKNISAQQEIDQILTELADDQAETRLQRDAWSIACLCKSCRHFLSSSALSLSWRKQCQYSSRSDDEYPQRRSACFQQSGHSGADDHSPQGRSFSQALEQCCRVYHRLKEILKEKGLCTAVGDEGGFAPNLGSEDEAFGLLMQAIDRAGFMPEEDFVLGIDTAASEWANPFPQSPDESMPDKPYTLPKSNLSYTAEELIAHWEGLCAKYPIRSIEDPLGENDWQSFVQITHRLGSRIQIVGDDLFVTNPERIREGIGMKAANAVLIKPNQIGTLSQTLEAVQIAQRAGWKTILSHRSGETEDCCIADIAVACGAGQIKTGAPCRGERTAKYNQLLRIEENLGNMAVFPKIF